MWNDARVRYDMELRRECVQFGMQRDDDLFLEKMEARFGSFHYLKDEIREIGTRAIVLPSPFERLDVSHFLIGENCIRARQRRIPFPLLNDCERLLPVSSRTNRWRERSEGDPPRDIGNEI